MYKESCEREFGMHPSHNMDILELGGPGGLLAWQSQLRNEPCTF